MTILTCTGSPDDELEAYRQHVSENRWELAMSGYWRETVYHSGYIAYYVQETSPGTWVMNGVERNAELDGVTEEDVEEGCLNDDQIQAMWGMTLEAAQNLRYERIVAVLLDAPAGLSSKEAATHLYRAVRAAGGKIITAADDDNDGLLG